MIVLAKTGVEEILKSYLNGEHSGGDLSLRLFVNDIIPSEDTAVGDFVECAGGGYAAKTLSGGSWTINTSSTPRESVYASQTFNFTGPISPNPILYGYYVVDSFDTLIWSERFTAPFQPTDPTDFVVIVPKFAGKTLA